MNAKKLYVSVLEGVGRYAAGMLAAAGCLFLLAGCGGVGPIFIDAVPEGYQVIYDMADLSEMTGQNKQGDGGENGGDTGTVYTAGTLDEILKIYDKSSQYELDTGHVKEIVFGSGLLEQEDKMKEVLRWREADRDVGRKELTLDDVFYRWNNYGELPEIPRILPSEKGLILV